MGYARTNNYVILAQKSNFVLCTAYISISVHESLIEIDQTRGNKTYAPGNIITPPLHYFAGCVRGLH